MPRGWLVPAICAALFSASRVSVADEFALRDGDRVVLLSNTLIERAQRYGYWEARLTSRYPKANITFRNLGWSGDTVFGEARARFGKPVDGFRHLKEHVFALKPTVLLISYGANASFEGKAGLAEFRSGLTHLLDTLAPTKARVAFIAPPRQENLGAPLPDPREHNRDLRLYRDVLREVARKRGFAFVDLFTLLGPPETLGPPRQFTDNGLHLTGYGYWQSAAAVEQGLKLSPPKWSIAVDARGGKPVVGETNGAAISSLQATAKGLRFEVLDDRLPSAPAPKGSPQAMARPETPRLLKISGLEQGTHQLRVDGAAVATATARGWAMGVVLRRGPEWVQAEALRRAIVAKNRLYFHRWRPQNETYLFGFRKHEQGRNAKEITQFDPLIAASEAAIAKLRRPSSRKYELAASPVR